MSVAELPIPISVPFSAVEPIGYTNGERELLSTQRYVCNRLHIRERQFSVFSVINTTIRESTF